MQRFKISPEVRFAIIVFVVIAALFFNYIINRI